MVSVFFILVKVARCLCLAFTKVIHKQYTSYLFVSLISRRKERLRSGSGTTRPTLCAEGVAVGTSTFKKSVVDGVDIPTPKLGTVSI